MVHTKWRTCFFKNQWIALEIEVFQLSVSLIFEMNYIILKLTWLTKSRGNFAYIFNIIAKPKFFQENKKLMKRNLQTIFNKF